ncbi:recombinase family protein [Halosimplex halobium]|uniref:recombinase family protein n=1 Tax=Halosimplex halobium TaxID=3396618 RepID=UPI003F54CB73
MAENAALYCRVSTEEQSLERQVDATEDYARNRLGIDLADLQFYRDKSTGTNTDRGAYRNLLDDVEAGHVDYVVCKDFSRLARSLQDLESTVDQITEDGAEVHFIDEGMQFRGEAEDDAMQRLMMQLLGAVAEFEANIRQQNTREGLAARMKSDEYSHGPAPLGFSKEDGKLYEGDDYDRACAVLDMVAKEEMSKRKAADELNSSRATIRRAIEERGELYGL